MRLVLSICLLWAVECSAATITIVPGNQTVSLGGAASADINISGLGNATAPSVGVYDFAVGFDPTILAFSSVNWGGGLDVLGLGDIQSATPGTGTVELFELSLDSTSDLNSLQPPAFRLFTLNFSTVAIGTSALSLTVTALGDADGATLPADTNNGSVTVADGAPSPDPEPSTTLPLLLVLGVGVQRLGRRK